LARTGLPHDLSDSLRLSLNCSGQNHALALGANVLRYVGSVHADMFKISIADTPSQRTLLVEGTLIRAWVAELVTTWRNTSRDLEGRKLVIDLTNVTVISPEAEDALFDLMKKGVNFSSDNVLTEHVLKQLARKKQQESRRKRGCRRQSTS
jgi:hypothetical protein